MVDVISLDAAAAADVPADPSTPAQVAVGGTATDNIDFVGDRDWYRVALTGGVLYSIQLQGNTLADPYLRLYDSRNVFIPLAQNNDFDGLNSHLTFRPNTSGNYYIAAAANHDDALGSYTMSVAAATIAPDLQVTLTAISASTVPTRGDLTLNITYTNSGTEAAPTSDIDVLLSTDPILSPSDRFAYDIPVSLIEAHTSIEITRTITLPSYIHGGNYYVGLSVDQINDIGELNESNNASATIPLTVSGPIPVGSNGDFTGDGRSDLLLHLKTGQLGILGPAGEPGTLTLRQSLGNIAPGWHVEQFGDFNADDRSEILFRHDSGAIATWQTNTSGQLTAIQTLGSASNAWHIEGVGDLDGNGRDDILFRNVDGSMALWQTNAAGQLASATMLGSTATSWHVAGIGDFDGNGRDDILFRHDNGAIAVWQTNAAGQLTSAQQIGTVASSWHIADLGDFDGNGRSEILFANNNGDLALWQTNSEGQLASALPFGNPGPQWQEWGTGDVDGNGRTDILWHDSSGRIVAWSMTQPGFQYFPVSFGPEDPASQIVLPHFDLM